jgi:trehalose synthase
VASDDRLYVHDPQPLGMGAIIEEERGVRAIWRSHIGLDKATPATRAAWDFLRPWLRACDRTVFSLGEYVPSFLSDKADTIHPAIDRSTTRTASSPYMS